jgi:hypothetical protein
LKEKYGSKAEHYIKFAEQIFEKWDTRGVWKWTGEYESRNAPGVGFSPY